MAELVKRVNTLGIPAIISVGTSLDTTKLTIKLKNHDNVSDYFQGFFVVYVNSLPTLPTPAVPVYVATDGLLGSEKQLFTPQGTEVTTAEIAEGVYLCFYDSTSGKLRVMM